MSNILYIFLGLFIMFSAYFTVTFGLGTLYFWVSKVKIALSKTLLISVSLAAAGFILGILSMIALSQTHIYVFAGVVSIVSGFAYFSVLRFLWKYRVTDAALVSVTLAIILNPAWFRLIGIL